MARPRTPLYLHEEIMLLALRDEAGTIATGSIYLYAIGGAILAELLMAQRITVEGGHRKLVNLVRNEPVGEPVIDDCLAKLAAAKRRAPGQIWVQRFANQKQLKHRVAQGLCDRHILRADEETLLLLFRRKVYPEIDPQPERELIERLRTAIFSSTREIEPRTIVLLSLAHSADLLKIPFDRKNLKQRKDRIKQLIAGERMGRATREAVEAAQTAAMLAATIPAMIAVTTTAR